MHKKGTISACDAVSHKITPIFYAQSGAACKKHGFNTVVGIKLCKRFSIYLFFKIFNSFYFETRMRAILTRRTSGTLKFILLTELSTDRTDLPSTRHQKNEWPGLPFAGHC